MNSDDECSESDGYEGQEIDYLPTVRQERRMRAPPIKLLTETDLEGYLQARFDYAEKGVLHWHPLMLRIIKRYITPSTRSPSEYLLGLVELILDIPIQLNVVHETYEIDINDTSVVIPYDGRMFIEAKHFVKMMLNDERPIITFENIRERARKWQQL
jgi:hypothetical protein